MIKEPKVILQKVDAVVHDLTKDGILVVTPNLGAYEVPNEDQAFFIIRFTFSKMPPRKMLKLTKMGKKFLKDNEKLQNFHKLQKKKEKWMILIEFTIDINYFF